MVYGSIGIIQLNQNKHTNSGIMLHRYWLIIFVHLSTNKIGELVSNMVKKYVRAKVIVFLIQYIPADCWL